MGWVGLWVGGVGDEGWVMEGAWEGGLRAYAADDLVVVGEVGFAVFAAVDAFGVEVDVVGEAHGWGCFGGRGGLGVSSVGLIGMLLRFS